MTLTDVLNKLSHKEIKALIRSYNLHTRIKLGQSKEALIEALNAHFNLNITDNKLIAKEYKVDIPTPAPIRATRRRPAPVELTEEEKKNKRIAEIENELNNIYSNLQAKDKETQAINDNLNKAIEEMKTRKAKKTLSKLLIEKVANLRKKKQDREIELLQQAQKQAQEEIQQQTPKQEEIQQQTPKQKEMIDIPTNKLYSIFKQFYGCGRIVGAQMKRNQMHRSDDAEKLEQIKKEYNITNITDLKKEIKSRFNIETDNINNWGNDLSSIDSFNEKCLKHYMEFYKYIIALIAKDERKDRLKNLLITSMAIRNKSKVDKEATEKATEKAQQELQALRDAKKTRKQAKETQQQTPKQEYEEMKEKLNTLITKLNIISDKAQDDIMADFRKKNITLTNNALINKTFKIKLDENKEYQKLKEQFNTENGNLGALALTHRIRERELLQQAQAQTQDERKDRLKNLLITSMAIRNKSKVDKEATEKATEKAQQELQALRDAKKTRKQAKETQQQTPKQVYEEMKEQLNTLIAKLNIISRKEQDDIMADFRKKNITLTNAKIDKSLKIKLDENKEYQKLKEQFDRGNGNLGALALEYRIRERELLQQAQAQTQDDRKDRLKNLLITSMDMRSKSKKDKEAIEKAQQELQALRDAKKTRKQAEKIPAKNKDMYDFIDKKLKEHYDERMRPHFQFRIIDDIQKAVRKYEKENNTILKQRGISLDDSLTKPDYLWYEKKPIQKSQAPQDKPKPQTQDERKDRLKNLLTLSMAIRNKSKVDKEATKKAQQELQALRDAKAQRMQAQAPSQTLTSPIYAKARFLRNMELGRARAKAKREAEATQAPQAPQAQRMQAEAPSQTLTSPIYAKARFLRNMELGRARAKAKREAEATQAPQDKPKPQTQDDRKDRLKNLLITSMDMRSKSKKDKEAIEKAQQELQALRDAKKTRKQTEAEPPTLEAKEQYIINNKKEVLKYYENEYIKTASQKNNTSIELSKLRKPYIKEAEEFYKQKGEKMTQSKLDKFMTKKIKENPALKALIDKDAEELQISQNFQDIYSKIEQASGQRRAFKKHTPLTKETIDTIYKDLQYNPNSGSTDYPYE